MKHRMFLAGLLGACLIAPAFAADAPAPPVVPAGETPARSPVKTEKKKPAPKKTPAKETSVKDAKTPPGTTKLANPEPAVAKEKNVNVRGQARINSEIVAHLTRGQRVMVLEEITTKKKENEPDRWFKISLPSTVSVWVNSSFLDANKAVTPKKLNARGGPGENFSVLGTLEKGATVNVLETKGDWSKIEPPASAYGFVAAHLLSRDASDLAASAPAIVKNTVPPPVAPPPVVAPPPPPTTTTVVPPPPVVAPTTIDPVVVAPPTPPPVVVAPPPPPPVDNPPVLTPVTAPPPEEILIKRVVTREGIVKGSVSIQAPSYFVLRSLDNNRTINYLVSPSTNIVVGGYRNQRVLITGEESLDERWPNTPVIEIESIKAVEP